MTISTALLNLCMGTWASRFRTFRRDRNHMYIANCYVGKRYLEAEGKLQIQQATFGILKFSHDSEALGLKLQIFHDSIVSQFLGEA